MATRRFPIMPLLAVVLVAVMVVAQILVSHGGAPADPDEVEPWMSEAEAWQFLQVLEQTPPEDRDAHWRQQRQRVRRALQKAGTE